MLRDLAWTPAVIAAGYATPEVPAGKLANFVTQDLAAIPYFGAAARPYLEAVMAQVGRSFLSAEILYGPNMEGPVLNEGFRLAVDDASNGVHLQLLDAIRRRSLREAATLDPLRRPYVYADHLDAIRAPVLLVAGTYDKLCNDDVCERDGFGRISSPDKTFLRADYGHVDLVLGRDAPRDVWAPIARWLLARR